MRKTELTIDQFTYSPPTAGTSSNILSYLVPTNSYIILRNDARMRLRFTASQTFTYSAAQSSDNVTVTVSGPVAQVSTIFGTTTNPDVSATAYWQATSPTAYTTKVEATAISGSNITFAVNDTTSTAATLTVYYLLATGTFSWTVKVPVSAGDVAAQIYGNSIASVNSLDQTSDGSSIYFPQLLILPQNFSLNLYVTSTPALNMQLGASTPTPNTLASLQIPILTGPMSEILAQDPQVKQHVIAKLLS